LQEFIHQPALTNRLGDFLDSNLNKPWHAFRAAVAFIKRSGTRHLAPAIKRFAKKSSVEIIAGVDLLGTSKEGLDDLLDSMGSSGRIIIFHNEIALTFHPKIYLFKSDSNAEVLVGSGNLTEGGLFTNHEAALRLKLDLNNNTSRTLLKSIEDVLDAWADTSTGTARVLDAALLKRLVALGYVPLEALAASASAEERANRRDAGFRTGKEERLFSSISVPRAPVLKRDESTGDRTRTRPAPASTYAIPSVRGFVITLQRTDVGKGQTTPGASQRSPELFLPTICVKSNPNFWGWPTLFKPDKSWKGPIDSDGFGKMDRKGVRMRLGNDVLDVNWWYNPDKKDYRLRHSALRRSGNVGDILRIEIADGKNGFDYYVETVPQGTTQFPIYDALCMENVRNSKKRFGYY
jgi:HKD family nuclease